MDMPDIEIAMKGTQWFLNILKFIRESMPKKEHDDGDEPQISIKTFSTRGEALDAAYHVAGFSDDGEEAHDAVICEKIDEERNLWIAGVRQYPSQFLWVTDALTLIDIWDILSTLARTTGKIDVASYHAFDLLRAGMMESDISTFRLLFTIEDVANKTQNQLVQDVLAGWTEGARARIDGYCDEMRDANILILRALLGLEDE